VRVPYLHMARKPRLRAKTGPIIELLAEVRRSREPAQGTSEAGKGKVFAATRSRCGGLAALVALLCACATAPAWAAVPGGYAVQRVDGPSPAAERSFGSAVAAVGDLNADGIADLAMGNSAAGSGKGEVVAVSGATGSTIWRGSPNGPAESSNTVAALGFGSRVAKLGDVAGCGTRDQQAAGEDCGRRAAADGVAEVLV
jgi:hypothetical protein